MVWPIVLPAVDWSTFIGQCVNAGLKSPALELNNKRETIDGPYALLKIIQSFEGKQVCGLKHCIISFLMVLDTKDKLKVATNTKLDIAINNESNLCIVTGNIECWKQAIKTLCKEQFNNTIIQRFNIVYLFLEQCGVARLLDIKKVPYEDRLFIVE